MESSAIRQPRPPRHLLFSPDYPPITGGISNFLRQRVAHADGVELAVVTQRSPGWREYDRTSGIATYRYAVPLNDVRFVRRFFQFTAGLFRLAASAAGGDAVIESGTALPGSFFGWLLKGLFGCRLATFVHGNDVLRPQQHRLTAWMLRKGLTASDLVIANSAFTAGILHEMGLDPASIKIINPAAETGRFHPDAGGAGVRRRHGLDGRTVLLVVSRLYDGRKGIETVLAALAALRDAMPELSLLIVGTGPARESLEEMAARMGLDGAVTFAGYVPDDELPAYYCASDIFVMVSDFDREAGDVEGYGIVYDEAHLCAKPCIAADAGGAPEAVHDGFDGLLVPPGDRDALAGAIKRLAHDPELAKRFGRSGRERILAKRYDWQALNRLGL